MLELYKTVMLMGNSPVGDLLVPPGSGWPFTSDQINRLRAHKSAAVIDLLRQLPYLRGSADDYAIAYHTTPINYYNSDWFTVDSAWDPYGGGSFTETYIEDFEVPLTFEHEHVGMILMLDTRNGMIREINAANDSVPCLLHTQPRQRCPLLFPHVCRYQARPTRPAVTVLEEYRQSFLELRWVVGGRGQPEILHDGVVDDPKDLDKIRQVYRENGWPHNFRPAECEAALMAMPDPNSEESESDDDAET